MTKATSSAVDFLAAIAGKTELFEVEGVTVELRGLEWTETQKLYALAENPPEMTFQAALMGLVAPMISEEQFRKAHPGAIQKISARVMEMSGLGAAASDSPLAGGGSLPATGTAQT